MKPENGDHAPENVMPPGRTQLLSKETPSTAMPSVTAPITVGLSGSEFNSKVGVRIDWVVSTPRTIENANFLQKLLFFSGKDSKISSNYQPFRSY